MSSKNWLPVGPMLAARTYFNPCSSAGLVYLCGGNETTVETYDPTADQCTLVEIQLPGSFLRSPCTALVWGAGLYIISEHETVTYLFQRRTTSVVTHDYLNVFSSCPPLCSLGNAYIMVGKTAKGLSLQENKVILNSQLRGNKVDS